VWGDTLGGKPEIGPRECLPRPAHPLGGEGGRGRARGRDYRDGDGVGWMRGALSFDFPAFPAALQNMQSTSQNRRAGPKTAPKLSWTDTIGTPRSACVFNELGPKSAFFDASCAHAVRPGKTRLGANLKLGSTQVFSELRGSRIENLRPRAGSTNNPPVAGSPGRRGSEADSSCPVNAFTRTLRLSLSGVWK
jgi:hypothetical protein